MKQWLNYLAAGLGIGLWIFAINCFNRQEDKNYREQKLRSSKKYDVSLGDDVYICTGDNAHAYHSYEECEGLKYCKDEIETISYQEAVRDYDRTPCHYCVQE